MDRCLRRVFIIDKKDLRVTLGAGSRRDVAIHHLVQDTRGPVGNFFGNTGKPGDVDSIALVGGATDELSQEDEAA